MLDHSSKSDGLRSGREALQILWERGLKGRELLIEHTRIVDAFLSKALSACPDAKGKMALIALGGYGRSELFPFSDIDVMLLYEPEVEDRVPAVAESVFYPLWDAGLEVGHGVRTVDACLVDAKKNFFFQVALLDARFIHGDDSLFLRLKHEFIQKFLKGREKAFVEDMIAHRKKRHRRFGANAYLLEPNIKESRGGLRDFHSIMWTSKVLFGLDDIKSIEEAGLITKEEKNLLEESWDYLLRIRNRLHYINLRKNDRLFFEYQEEVCSFLGHKDSKNMLGVEHFMKEVYEHLQNIAITSDLFFENVEELLKLSTCKKQNKILEPGIEVIDCRIKLTDPSLLEKFPYLLMRIFAHAAKTGLPIHYKTRRLISANLDLVDEDLRSSKRMAKAFMQTLQDAKKPLKILEALLDSGLLAAYIPEFSVIKSLGQHDVYHVHTVDRHLLQTVAELHDLKEEEPRIFMALESPHILYLAALLHDIGKGHGGHHAERGGEIVQNIGDKMGLSLEECACLSFLVQKHLYLVHIATRRDLEDETLILNCSREIQDIERLNMLYLLTIADSKATGPNVWNDWKAALVHDLYLKITLFLEGSEFYDYQRNQALDWMKHQIASRLGEKGKKSLAIMPDDYILGFTPEDIERHIQLKTRLSDQPSLVLAEDRRTYWSLLVMAKDRTGLLARIFGILALHNLNVLVAQIFTLRDGTAIDVLDVKSSVNKGYDEQDWETLKKNLNLALDSRLGLAHRLAEKYRPITSGDWQKCLKRRAQVILNNEASDFFTIVEVYAEDRIGLLYDITRTLADFGINIFMAKIGTKIDQVVDVFYVQDKKGQKISTPDLQEEIRKALLYAVNCGML
ncbi:MAG: [protein-PII] uridylyltransferase [Deltaproteobacteria bacterium]|nr:[protein-PII] uridylyltransferase [Deltaproteobacteria bacterium]